MAMDVPSAVSSVKARLAQFSGPQKTIVALLTVVGLVACGFFYSWVSAPTYAVLMAGMEPTDAAAVTAQLDSSGVKYQLAANGTTVMVPAGDVQAQRLAVAAAGLPHGTTKGYELLDAQGMTSSSFQQKIAYQRAVEGELDKTLQQMQDVRTATVHLSLPDAELYTDKAKPARASVLLDTRNPLDHNAVDAVQRLVAAAVPNLAPDGVMVTDTQGTVLSGSTSGSGAAADAEQQLEDAASARADTMLSGVLGPGKAVVRVNAELDPTTRTTESETYDPKKSVALRKSGSSETYDTNGAAAAGGTVSVPSPAAVAGSAGNGTGKYQKTDGSTDFGVDHKTENASVGPGALKRMTVAVVLDTRSNAPAKQVVSDLVANAVRLDLKRGDTISVAFAPFNASAQPPATTAAAGRDLTRTATEGLAVLLLLLVALAFWRTARRGTIAEIPLETLAVAGPETVAVEAAAVPLALDAGLRESAEQDARILELVDSRPEEVSVLIRNWLAEPAEAAK